MRLRNSDGTPVDPVPFLVVALLGVMIAISLGPLYLKSHGVGEPTAVTASIGLAAATVGSSYYRYVWTANPVARRTVPAAVRFRKLVYGMVIAVVVVLALVGLLHL